MWKINWFTHLVSFTSEKICLEVKLDLKNIGNIRMDSFTCSHRGRWYRQERSLKRHGRSSHMSQPLYSCNQCGRSFSRGDNLQNHMRNCTGRGVVVPAVAVPAAKKRCTGVARERLQFKLQKMRETLEGNAQQFTVNMKEAKSHSTLEKAIAVLKPVMMDFPTEA